MANPIIALYRMNDGDKNTSDRNGESLKESLWYIVFCREAAFISSVQGHNVSSSVEQIEIDVDCLVARVQGKWRIIMQVSCWTRLEVIYSENNVPQYCNVYCITIMSYRSHIENHNAIFI